MSVDNLSDQWTNKQAYAWREHYLPLLASISLSFCIVAQILFYIFPRLRQFPRSLLSWVNLYNIYYLVFTLIRWVPGSPWHKSLTSYRTDIVSCKFNVFADVTAITGQYVCGTLLCLSIFLMVVRKVDLEKRRIYFWCFLAAATLIPAIVVIPAILVSSAKVPTGGPCIIAEGTVNYLVRSPYMVMLAIQLVLLIWTMRFVNHIVTAVRSSCTATLPIRFIFARFICTIAAQVFNILPAQLLMTFPATTYQHAIYTRFAIVSHSFGPTLIALIMIIGNPEFTGWLFNTCSTIIKYWKERDSGATTQSWKACIDSLRSKTKGGCSDRKTSDGIELAMISSDINQVNTQ